jgi:hypothetical protein
MDNENSENRPEKRVKPLVVEYRTDALKPWMREVFNEYLSIEEESAQSAGTVGFMARTMVMATLPYKDPKQDIFVRKNGDFTLKVLAGYSGGIPYGIYPRLLMSWVVTEAVRTKSPVLELGDSLSFFMRDVLNIRTSTGGVNGSGTRVSEQMKRLFGSMVTAGYAGSGNKRGFSLRNVMLADQLDLSAEDSKSFNLDRPLETAGVIHESGLWVPTLSEEANIWKSSVRLNARFFDECVNSPVPIDLRVYKVLKGSPLAMDIYAWLTFRMSYLKKRGKPIPWAALMMQFGSSFGGNEAGPPSDQALRDFRKAFIKQLKVVLVLYPEAKIDIEENGLVLFPSRPSVLPVKSSEQTGQKTSQIPDAQGDLFS